jgi:hypothetical protein
MKRIVLFALLGGCTHQRSASVTGGPPDAGVYVWQADNPIDQVMRAQLAAAGFTPLAAPDREFCRRASADLRGFVPTPEEIAAHCAGKSPSEIVAWLESTPEYVELETRLWLQALEVDPGKVFAQELLDLDPLIAQLAQGALAYDAFAVTVVGMPAVTTNVQPTVCMFPQPPMRYDEAADRVMRLFRGRAPVGTEKAELAKLFSVWTRSIVPDPDLSYGRYSPELAPERCSNALGAVACSARLDGQLIAIQLPVGHVSWEDFGGEVPPEVLAELQKPGTWLAGDDEFWQAASARVLSRLLGWYRSTKNLYESDLPDVRAALAERFKSQPSWPQLLATVMTSVLYAQSAAPGGALDRPDWASGPTKFLSAEGRLQSLGVVLGRQLGFCDPHTGEPIGTDRYFPDRLRRAQPDDFYGFGVDFFQTYGAMLGGCRGAVTQPRQPSLARVFAEPTAVSVLLADSGTHLGPPGFVPDGSDLKLLQLGDWIAQRAYGRGLADDERALTLQGAAACRADAACDADPVIEARSLATSMLVAAEAGVY